MPPYKKTILIKKKKIFMMIKILYNVFGVIKL